VFNLSAGAESTGLGLFVSRALFADLALSAYEAGEAHLFCDRPGNFASQQRRSTEMGKVRLRVDDMNCFVRASLAMAEPDFEVCHWFDRASDSIVKATGRSGSLDSIWAKRRARSSCVS